MADSIILLFVLVIIIFAVKGSIKHFKGEGGCCGGGSKGVIKAERKKLLHPKMGEKTVKIYGMHCEHCAERVARAINKIDGVSYKKGRAIVSYDREISDKQIRDAVEEAGYKVTGIQ